MRKSAALLVILTLLMPLLIMTVKPVSAASPNSWTTKAPMPTARAYLGVTAVNGRIYAIGGADPPDWVQAIGTNEEYDPTKDTWTLKAPMPTNRSQFGIAAYKNKIYCLGGVYGNAVYSNGVFSYFDVYEVATNEVYDLATNTWENKAPIPDSRAGVSAHLVDGKIYLLGGNSTANDVYDPATDTWAAKAPIPISLYEYGWWTCCSAVVDDKIHVVGLGVNVHFHLVYDPESDNWSSAALWPPGAIYSSSAATTGTNAPKRMYVFGVDSLWWDLDLPDFATLVYSSENDSWTTGASMPTGRINVGVTVLDNTFYAIGGSTLEIGNNRHASPVNQQYIPIGYENSEPTSSPEPTSTPTFTPGSEQVQVVPILVAAVAGVVVAGAGFLLYRKRVRGKPQ
jgi:energy-converting hydrogenase Eha subunit A